MRRRVILAGLLAAAVILLAAATPWRSWLGGLAAWARAAGPAGAGAFALAYAAGSVLALPVWPLTVAAGVAYGPAWGFAVALPSGTLGATLAFLAGRTFLRGAVERRLARDPRLVALDRAVDREGAVLVLLLRLSPLAPYNVVTYALSATRLRVVSFAAASFVGMAPITFAWAWAGGALGSLEGLGAGPPPGPMAQALRWGGLLATVAVVALLGRMGRRVLREATGPGE
jgi:uncharacterized membrane protein YdjX (TVP38/TMEM64 family)